MGGFSLCKEAQYPSHARAAVKVVQENARHLKNIKDQIRQALESFTDPEQLLSIQPLITAWEEHINKISQADHGIRHDELPGLVRELLKIMNEGIVFDKRQLLNINDQIAVLRASAELSFNKSMLLLEERLLPLMEGEEQIERERQASNLERWITELPQKMGY
jgi:hypothetical protein